MAKQALFFGGEISRNYEDYLGSFLFEPFAVDLASRIDWTGVGEVLELACGSGRLTRHIAEQLPQTVAFTATDLNEDMIRVAKDRVPSDRVKWAPADMLELSFKNGSFDLVICQFGIMLVPDPEKALAEIFRVLKPGGKVLFSTWTDLQYNRLWAIGNFVIKSIVGKSPIEQEPGPFMLGDKFFVEDMLKQRGFGSIKAAVVTNTGVVDSAKKASFGFIYGLPVGLFIRKEKADGLQDVLQALEAQLKEELGDHPLQVPQKASVFEAVKNV